MRGGEKGVPNLLGGGGGGLAQGLGGGGGSPTLPDSPGVVTLRWLAVSVSLQALVLFDCSGGRLSRRRAVACAVDQGHPAAHSEAMRGLPIVKGGGGGQGLGIRSGGGGGGMKAE